MTSTSSQQDLPVARTDEDLCQDVLCRLAWDDRLAAQTIAVSVAHGVVTLSGVVDDWPTQHAAAEVAHQVAEVRDVANEIQVRSAEIDRPTDPDLALAVRRALGWDAKLPERDIQSTVAAGVVTLDGVVATAGQRAEAARVVRHVNGVRRVQNRLQVVAPPR